MAMIIPGDVSPMMAVTVGGDPLDEYGRIERSVRLRAAATAYLSRTFGTPTNQNKWTIAVWVKRGMLGTAQGQFPLISMASAETTLRFIGSGAPSNADKLEFRNAASAIATTSQVFRGPSAFAFVLLSYDNALGSGNLKLSWNGEVISQTNYTTSTGLNSAVTHYIGAAHGLLANFFFDGYLANYCFVDGQALTADAFGLFHPRTGQWRPKSKSAIRAAVAAGGGARNGWGNNGFFLPFDDTTSTTTLGYDRSQSDTDTAGNNWTANNVSLTAGTTYDSMLDTPTANYCTLNPLTANIYNANPSVISNGGLSITRAGAGRGGALSMPLPSNQLVYFEAKSTNAGVHKTIGIIASNDPYSGEFYNGEWYIQKAGANSLIWIIPNAELRNGSALVLSGLGSLLTTDVMRFAIDTATGRVWVGKNTTWFNGGDPAAGTGHVFTLPTGRTYYASCEVESGSVFEFNFGQRGFEQTVPTGFKALNTKNLPVIPASGIMRSDDHVDIHLRTGNGGSNTVTGKRFPPGVIWSKGRSGATSHALYDIVRGPTKDLAVDTTAVETTQATGITAFNSDGYSLGSLAKLNTNTATYLDFLLRTGDSTVTNTAGSISAQVSANVKAGVSVITFTGTGANATVGHGLGKKPTFFIVKNLDYNLGSFNVYHAALGATKRLLLDLPDGEATVATAWNNTEPTSSVIHLGSLNSVNNSGDRIVIYAFTDIEGFSKAFSYTGTASADGPFVGLDMSVLTAFIKNASASVNWVWYNRRSIPSNVANVYLEPDTPDAETNDGTGATARMVDLVSNGIKARTSGADAINSNAALHVGFAFAEFPFRYANER